eukprot:CAMPEP_0184017510 /NCGR_PEP_ID=MMETSP0954-20121128/7578_1 /TAXON_ID=627963 /ORGANISM="Aplanochytrium sp, Strain PBS07" /LENGTH=267 /DNA_ID=CAMNT_0026298757 /DNA_START=198 /DNA_END=1002 /DNA_ORIENTATION=-
MSQFPLPPQLAVQGYTIVQQSDGEVQPHFVVAPNQPYTVSYVQTPGVVPYYPAPYQQGVNSLLAHPPQTQAVSWSVGPVGGQNLQLQTAKPFKVLQASSSAPIAVGNSSATVRQVSRSSTVSSSSKRPLSHQPEKKARKRKRKVCQHEGCSKVSQGKTPFCLSHGGGYRCKWKGCSNGARGKSGFCITHGGGKLCKHKGCKTAAGGSLTYAYAMEEASVVNSRSVPSRLKERQTYVSVMVEENDAVSLAVELVLREDLTFAPVMRES